MTNDELSNISPPLLENDFIFNLPYEKTAWGLFYATYKEQGQGQLQKAILKNKNELLKSNKIKLNPHEKVKWVQHIFYSTEWDEKEQKYKTPFILLRHSTHGYNDSKWCED
jgi:3-dehydroquinate synthetase